eukprot:scaffold106608_cov18-Tisochrysis_lutea.AAC.1
MMQAKLEHTGAGGLSFALKDLRQEDAGYRLQKQMNSQQRMQPTPNLPQPGTGDAQSSQFQPSTPCSFSETAW